MVTYGDAKQVDSTQLNTVGGDLLVLLSGLCYAAYTVRQAPPVLTCHPIWLVIPCSDISETSTFC